ncbi:MAG: hypothetical protein AAFN27_00335 [Pseudomonadota bacterium]
MRQKNLISRFLRAPFCVVLFLSACSSEPPPEPTAGNCGSLTEPELELSVAMGSLDLSSKQIEIADALDPGQTFVLTASAIESTSALEISGPITGPKNTGPWRAAVVDEPAGRAFRAPSLPGSYALRLLSDGEVVAEGELEIVAHDLSLCAVDEARLDEQIALIWKGPGAPGDRIQIVDEVEETVVAEAAAIRSGLRRTATNFNAPDRAGMFSIRYVDARETVLIERDLVVIPTRLNAVQLLTPRKVIPGRKFRVVWTGTRKPGFVFRLFNVGEGRELVRLPGEGDEQGPISAVFRAPKSPGDYAVQYLDPEKREAIRHSNQLAFD